VPVEQQQPPVLRLFGLVSGLRALLAS